MKTGFIEQFRAFLTENDEEKRDRIWDQQSDIFRNFWNDRIINGKKEPDDSEIDQVVRILDRNGKGNTKSSIAVAKAMVPQGVWRRLFKEIQKDKELHSLINNLFRAKTNDEQIELVDKLYDYNKTEKNGLTGTSGNVINAMLFAYAPKNYTSIISFNDRKRVIDYFGFQDKEVIVNGTPGQKLVLSNSSILKGFRELGLSNSPDTIARFLYSPQFKDNWKNDMKSPSVQKVIPDVESDEEMGDSSKVSSSSFAMENELENFLITNWEKTELGKNYDLLVEDGELVSQQYPTGIGKIDILAIEKKTKIFTVIELKKGKTSDDTIGQLLRYMGWLEENKTNGQKTKGIIIALEYDERLYYASKKIPDVEIYLYRISFYLEDHRKPK